VERIRIDRPNPQKPFVDYPSITFQPDDGVTISAGGCVQSGGHGATWHRYVNPSGGDSDKLYHGLITIPFATGSLERIQKYQNQQVHVAPNAPTGNLHLQLGFEDDDYSDNGYYDPDDGPNDQCKAGDGGPAWVELTIVHKVGGSVGNPGGGHDWDVVTTQFDDNGIPLNPDWWSNVNKHQFPSPDTCRWPWNDASSMPDCVSQAQITNTDEHYTCEARYVLSDHGLGGHANWMAATFTGTANWDQHSNAYLDDDDYSLNVNTDGRAAATQGLTTGVHVEFDSDETVEPLSEEFNLPQWQAFQNAVDQGDPHSFLDGKEVVVTGLMGVDFVHTPATESHPAWAFAWHANNDFEDDTWAFFVRNWGNEGYCSGDQHYVSYVGNQYTFRFKWPAGATSGVARSGTTFLANTTAGAATVSFLPNEAVLLTFHDLPQPDAQGLIAGELHIKWSGTPLRRFPLPGQISSVPQRGRLSRIPAAAAEDAESFIADEVSHLTPAQRAQYFANAPKKARPAPKQVFSMRWQTGPPPAKLGMNVHPQLRTAPDRVSAAYKDAQIEALRKAGGRIPTVQPHTRPAR
jgi:hypothetical protein